MPVAGRTALMLALCLAGGGAAIAQPAVDPAVLAPARPGLDAVPLPSLEGLETAVAEQLREARGAVDRAAASQPLRQQLSDAYGLLGQTYHAYEFFEPAEAAYANAARLAPNEARWQHLLGYLYQQTGRLEEAADRLAAARRAQPEDHAATVRLGEVYLGLNRLGDARREFQRVVQIFPAAARNGLGEVALREGRYEEAIAHFNAALERVPQAAAIHYSLGMAYRGLGRLDDARTHLERRGQSGVRAVDPIVETLQALVRGERALVMQGRRAYDAGHFEEAAAAFRRAVDAAPASVAARVNLGLAESQLGNTVAAVKHFESALDLDPGSREAHLGLGTLLTRQGRDADAVRHLRAAFSGSPGDAGVGRELTGALLRLGRAADAIDVLRTATAADPANEDTLLGLAILLADQSRFAESVALLEEAHRRFPDRAATATTLARLLASSPDVSSRDGGRALEVAMAVYASDPAPEHAETVALALAELGRCAEALEWMRRARADAAREGDAAGAERLARETPRYETTTCRAPER